MDTLISSKAYMGRGYGAWSPRETLENKKKLNNWETLTGNIKKKRFFPHWLRNQKKEKNSQTLKLLPFRSLEPSSISVPLLHHCLIKIICAGNRIPKNQPNHFSPFRLLWICVFWTLEWWIEPAARSGLFKRVWSFVSLWFRFFSYTGFESGIVLLISNSNPLFGFVFFGIPVLSEAFLSSLMSGFKWLLSCLIIIVQMEETF